MGPPADGEMSSPERQGWELAQLKLRVEQGFANIDARFDRLGTQVSTLQFVDVRLYNSEQATQDRAITNLATTIEAVEKRIGARCDAAEHGNRATLVLLLGVILTALAGGLIRLALG